MITVDLPSPEFVAGSDALARAGPDGSRVERRRLHPGVPRHRRCPRRGGSAARCGSSPRDDRRRPMDHGDAAALASGRRHRAQRVARPCGPDLRRAGRHPRTCLRRQRRPARRHAVPFRARSELGQRPPDARDGGRVHRQRPGRAPAGPRRHGRADDRAVDVRGRGPARPHDRRRRRAPPRHGAVGLPAPPRARRRDVRAGRRAGRRDGRPHRRPGQHRRLPCRAARESATSTSRARRQRRSPWSGCAQPSPRRCPSRGRGSSACSTPGPPSPARPTAGATSRSACTSTRPRTTRPPRPRRRWSGYATQACRNWPRPRCAPARGTRAASRCRSWRPRERPASPCPTPSSTPSRRPSPACVPAGRSLRH